HRDLTDLDAVIIPGGFSFGDYLRCGALAARSALMEDVRRFAEKGGAVLGICNGFQILCESGLLPGALVRNRGGRFIDDWVELEVVNAAERFGVHHKRGQRLRLPIAHGEGRFYAPADELKSLFDQGQIWLRYSLNPNGSLQDIAGVLSKNKRVAGLMPHPERALFDWMGGTDGWGFLP
ncbi:MAG: phosphoribosylformylglycinamidine synthase subunit PurQ, partial [Bdellovibrionaceae bacterium]|nr:phosphoribosylformylglycinamidine synthase subunit PurQ [Pseudobdellovibrionaceae bacterium]